MYIDRFAYPITTLGPGNRIVIWTIGCSKRCPNCISPDLWDINGRSNMSNRKIARLIIKAIANNNLDGVTISGGDPFEQIEDLMKVLCKVRKHVRDILAYTGYDYAEFQKCANSRLKKNMEKNIDVVIDGAYIHELNDNSTALMGSSNQNVIYNTKSLIDKYEAYMKKGRTIQSLILDKKIVTIGIHDR